MPAKFIHNSVNVLIWLSFWLLITGAMRIGGYMYYTYAPIENFVSFEKFDFQDYKKQEPIQILYSYRNSYLNTIWDFQYRFYCNGKTNIQWAYRSEDILLPKTEWVKKTEIEMPVRLDLPVGQCKAETLIEVNVRWFTRYIELSDYFNVK